MLASPHKHQSRRTDETGMGMRPGQCGMCWCMRYHGGRLATKPGLVQTVAEPPELSRLKCAGHHHKGNTGSNALQTEQFLVCRVTFRYNHRFSDRRSIPRTKASPEILQPHVLQHKLSSDYKPVQTIITKPNLVKQLYKP